MMAERLDLKSERPKRSLWKRIVDLAMADVGTLVKGIDERSIEDLEQLLLKADFGVDATMELVDDLDVPPGRARFGARPSCASFSRPGSGACWRMASRRGSWPDRRREWR